MTSEEKVFLKWSDQVNKLEERHLVFRDDIEKRNAKYALQNNSYYALVNGYKNFFCVSNTSGEDDFQNELFIDLRDTFDFDKELSAIIFKYLLRIEDSIKAIFSYYVGQTHGHKDSDYLDPCVFRKGRDVKKLKKFERDIIIEKLEDIISKKMEPQLIHYRSKYGYVPSWVLASCVSMDNLMFWYKLSDRHIKRRVIQTMMYDYSQYPWTFITDEEENLELFTNLMTIIKEYRNRAAHGNRIINHQSKHNIKINLLELYACNRRVLMQEYENGALKGDVFSLFVAITIMLSKRDTVRCKFIRELEILFSEFEKENSVLYKKVIGKVNLPHDFANILRGVVRK